MGVIGVIGAGVGVIGAGVGVIGAGVVGAAAVFCFLAISRMIWWFVSSDDLFLVGFSAFASFVGRSFSAFFGAASSVGGIMPLEGADGVVPEVVVGGIMPVEGADGVVPEVVPTVPAAPMLSSASIEARIGTM